MSVFRYDTHGVWYKGNCHVHSTVSDGGKTFAELARMYADAGYDFLFRTDHGIASDVDADEQMSPHVSCGHCPLLWLDGIEIDGQDYGGSRYHAVCLGTFTGIAPGMGFVAALEAARAQGGLLILAHPHWMGNSLEDAVRWGFHGVEIYNHVCQWLNGKGDGTVYWNAMLQRAPNTLALAVDDAHIRPEHPGWNGGWIMVNMPDSQQSPRARREAILDAIRAGHFYSTNGPEFHSIEYDGTYVTVKTSPVQFVRLVGPADRGDRIGSFDGSTISEASLQIRQDWPYAYLEVEDAQGRRAWTNTLFVERAG